MKTPSSIDEYLNGFPENIREILHQVRKTIQNAAPDAEEKISYGIPTFVQNGILVHFAAFKNHIGFYALPSGHAEFNEKLSKYKMGKGSVQFPLSEPMPLDLIAEITRFRVAENLSKVK